MNKHHGYKASADDQIEKKMEATNNTFNQEQMEQLYKMFSSLQSAGQSSNSMSSGSLAHRGNFLRALNTIFQTKIPWIVDSGAFDHMTNNYHIFSTYSPCAGNIKVKIADGSLSTVAGKGTIKLLFFNPRKCLPRSKLVLQFLVN